MGVWAPAHSNTLLIFHLVGNNRLRLLSVGHHAGSKQHTKHETTAHTQVERRVGHTCTSRQRRMLRGYTLYVE